MKSKKEKKSVKPTPIELKTEAKKFSMMLRTPPPNVQAEITVHQKLKYGKPPKDEKEVK